jgi:hypothetical protein
MIREEDIFIDGERRLGRYSVVLLQPVEGEERWMPSVMTLNALISNYRLILQPYKRKYAPAILPARYIRDVSQTQVSGYNCVSLTLITGDQFYLMLGTGNLNHLYDDLRVMKTRPLKIRIDEPADPQAIRRLINFLRRV